eukprot:7042889-Lingulodinium_polyedra.AAC.1
MFAAQGGQLVGRLVAKGLQHADAPGHQVVVRRVGPPDLVHLHWHRDGVHEPPKGCPEVDMIAMSPPPAAPEALDHVGTVRPEVDLLSRSLAPLQGLDHREELSTRHGLPFAWQRPTAPRQDKGACIAVANQAEAVGAPPQPGVLGELAAAAVRKDVAAVEEVLAEIALVDLIARRLNRCPGRWHQPPAPEDGAC